MIGYDSMLARDAFNYFHNCWAFHVSDDGCTVTPHVLCMEYGEEDECEPAHDYCYLAAVLGKDGTQGQTVEVTGEELFMGTQWITHRFQLGYISIDGTRCLRLDAEPVNSRMTKGLQASYCNSLPLVVVATNPRPREATVRELARRTQGQLDFRVIPYAIARVLSVAATPVMRGRIPLQEGHARSRATVKRFMSNMKESVCVPDFRIALIKHRSHNDFAYILHNGTYIGKARLNPDGEVYCELNKPRTASRRVKKYIEDTRLNLAHTLISLETKWAAR